MFPVIARYRAVFADADVVISGNAKTQRGDVLDPDGQPLPMLMSKRQSSIRAFLKSQRLTFWFSWYRKLEEKIKLG